MKKKKNQLSKKTIYYTIGAIAIIAVIALVVSLVLNNSGTNDTNKTDDPNIEKPKGPTPSEESIKSEFGMSADDAIELIKTVFTGDAYEYSAKATSDNKYEVTANNTITNTKIVFIVDPGTKQWSFKG